MINPAIHPQALQRPAIVSNRYQLCIFEDHIAVDLTPYQLSRPCYTIPSGFYNLIERVQLFVPHAPLTLMCRPQHELLLKKRCPKVPVNQLNKSLPTFYLNGRCNAHPHHLLSLLDNINPNKNTLFIHGQSVIGLYCQDDFNETVFQLLLECPSFDDIVKVARQQCLVEDKKQLNLVAHWWDYLDQLPTNLGIDFDLFSKQSLLEGDISSFTTLINDQQMYIDQLSTVREYVSLDASDGPIVIMDGVTIQPFVRIKGPCYIGAHSTIHSHADISDSYIGHDCKIGGEVKRCLIQSFTNKGHHGFIGDSMIGEWVNLGAGTTVSNLKLSYGAISSHDNRTQRKQNSERQFLGAIFGDYIRTGIQSLFECGSVISSGCSLHGADAHATFIPPFTWGASNAYSHQDIPAFTESLRRMMARRNISMSEDEDLLFKRLFDALHSAAPATSQHQA